MTTSRLTFAVAISIALLAPIGRCAEPAVPDLAERLFALPAPAPMWTARNGDYVPPDDAPVDELMDFWVYQRFSDFEHEPPAPTDAVCRKLLAAWVEQPKYFPSVLAVISDSPEVIADVKAIYDKPSGAGGLNADGKSAARHWLMTRTRYFLADLTATAARNSTDDGEKSEMCNALEALARLDWPAAEPLLRKKSQEKKPALASWALAIQYRHAIGAGDKPAASTLRRRLRDIAGDKDGDIGDRGGGGGGGAPRLTAINVLLESAWEGQSEWIASLLADMSLCSLDGPLSTGRTLFTGGQASEALFDGLDEVLKREPDRFIPVLAKLTPSKNAVIRKASAMRLLKFPRADALVPLLPWLTNKDWATGDGRLDLLLALGKVPVPESVAPLSRLAQAPLVPNQDIDAGEITAIAMALDFQHCPAAPAALRKAVDLINDVRTNGSLFGGPRYSVDIENGDVARAAVNSGVLADAEIATAIEAYARRVAARDENRGLFSSSSEPWPHDACVGASLADVTVPWRGALPKLLNRWKVLHASNPAIALALWDNLAVRPGREVDDVLLRRLSDFPLEEQAVTSALARAPQMREHVGKGLRDLAHRGGYSSGAAAAVLSDKDILREILEGPDRRAKILLLACARLGRVPLPLASVARFLESGDLPLVHAAERYLVCEDSPQARQLVLARHQGEAIILGASTWGHFHNETTLPDPSMSDDEEPFRHEVLAKDGPDEIIALLGGGMNGDVGSCIIRVRANAAMLEVQPWQTPGKLLTRQLLPAELTRIRDFLGREHVDDLPQLMTAGADGCFYNYFRVTRDGGRRVVMHEPGSLGTAGTPHARLTSLFRILATSGKFQTHYALEAAVPGTKLLLADSDHPISSVWIRGNDLRVRIDEAGAVAWHAFHDGRVGDIVAPPAEFVSTAQAEPTLPEDFQSQGPSPENRWKAVVGDSMIVVGQSANIREDRLFRVRTGEPPVQIGDVHASDPVMTFDDRFIFATRQGGDHAGALVRIEIATGKAMNIDLPGDHTYTAVAYVPIIDKILVMSGPEVWFVDPATGKAQKVEGNLEPLLHSRGRPVLSPGSADEVWLAVQDASAQTTHIGRYDLRRLTWTEVLAVSQLTVFNDQIAVEEDGRALYVVTNGDLLRVPIVGAGKKTR